MASERDILSQRLGQFFARHDPVRLQTGIDAVVDFGLGEGMAALNAALMDRYGDYLDSGSDHAFGSGDRQIIRSRIELFYLKNDPAKLDSVGDMEAIVDWAMYNGVDQLSEKLGRKYDEGIEDVRESDVVVQLEAFYERHDKTKTEDEIRTVLTWGIVHGFTLLNQKMIEKYGEGLGSLDRAKVRLEVQSKLSDFYTSNDKSKLDEENLEFIVDWALKNGMHSLNTRLQAKYGCNMNTIAKATMTPRSRPSLEGPLAADRGFGSGAGGKAKANVAGARKSVRKSLKALASKANKATGGHNGPAEQGGVRMSMSAADAELAVQADIAYQEYLRKLVEVFYARHDPNRLLEEGVTPIIDFAIRAGEEALNAKLRKKYGEDLLDVHAQFQETRERLIRYYTKYDATKLEPENEKDLDTIVGWALVHGVDKLNDTLMRKYDEDLDGSGLMARLRLFYAAYEKKDKSDADLRAIVDWVFENSVDALNKKLKKKYGTSLEDTTFAEAEKDEPPPPPPIVDDATISAIIQNRAPPKPSGGSQKKNRKKKVPAPAGPPPAPPLDDFAALPDEGARHETHDALEERLMMFYRKKNPTKATKQQVKDDVRKILLHGIDAFNKGLLKVYGESLVSVEKHSNLNPSRASINQARAATLKAKAKQKKAATLDAV